MKHCKCLKWQKNTQIHIFCQCTIWIWTDNWLYITCKPCSGTPMTFKTWWKHQCRVDIICPLPWFRFLYINRVLGYLSLQTIWQMRLTQARTMVRGHSTTTWTKFWPPPPQVDKNGREWISTGARTRRSLWHHLFHPLILRLLVLCAPAVLRLRALQDAPAPADPNS